MKIHHQPRVAHGVGMWRFLRSVAFATMAITALAASPLSFAGSPDGSYKFVKGSGYASFAGERYELDESMIEDLGIIDQTNIRIARKSMKIDKNAATKMVDQLSEEYGIPVQMSVTGPSSLKLKKSGRSWVGKTSQPIVVSFSATYSGMEIAGQLSSRISITIRGKKMVMTTPVSGEVLGETITAKAQTIWTR